MSRTALLVPCAFAILVLAGCQSEEEKRAEREKLKSELRSELITELNSIVSSEVRDQLQRAIEDHRRKLAEQAAAAKAATPAPKAGTAAPKAPAKKH